MSIEERIKLIERIVYKITSLRNIFTDEALIELDKQLDEIMIRK